VGRITGGAAGRGGGSYPGDVGGVGVSLSAGGLILNSGTIAAGGNYAFGLAMRAGGTVNNTGTIGGSTGVFMANGGTIYNGGRIVGYGPGGDFGQNGVGVYVEATTGTAVVTNAGTIIGYGKLINPLGGPFEGAVGLMCAGTFTNEVGALAIGYYGVSSSGLTSIVNYGVIDGVQRCGASADFVINHAGGLIEGATMGVSVFFGTVTNFGTIAGTQLSVYLQRESRLIAEVGSTFIGEVLADSVDSTLELAGGREFVTGLGGVGTISGGLAMTFSGIGTYQFDAGGQFILRGNDALASGRTLADHGALAVSGTMNQLGTVTIGTDAAAARLSILKTGAWNLDGAVVTGGAASGERINNYGALTNTGGASEIGVVTFDDGTIDVAAGRLDIANSLWGIGSLTIHSGATLEVDAVVGQKLTVNFNGASATLDLSQPTKFTSTIDGFAAGDTIDLLHIKATGASANASDQLVIVDRAATVATLQLNGGYGGAIFAVGPDRHGGTNITLATAGVDLSPGAASHVPSVAVLVSAMAGLGASMASTPTTSPHIDAWRPTLVVQGRSWRDGSP
jgi:hypothetical protein